MIDSLGLLEVRGLVAGIEAADAMLKSARVRLLRQHQVNPALITLVVEGNLAACRASVDAGAAAAKRVGEVISQLVIGAPASDTDDFVLDLAGSSARSFVVPNGTKEPAQTGTMETAASTTTVVEAGAEAESEPEPEPPVSATVSLKEVLDFISRFARGVTWREIADRFLGVSQEVRGDLDQAVQNGTLSKAGGRYRMISEVKPKVSSSVKKKRTK